MLGLVVASMANCEKPTCHHLSTTLHKIICKTANKLFIWRKIIEEHGKYQMVVSIKV